MNNKIHCGNCLDIMPKIEDKTIDLILTDPPYGIDFQSARRTDKTQWKSKIANDTEPFIDWIPDSYRILKDGGRMICFCRWDVQEVFRLALVNAGFIVKSQIIWDKVIHGMGDLRGEFAPQHEIALYATKGRYIFSGKRPKTIIQCQRVDAEKLTHPNEKPIGLLKCLIKSLTNENDTVLDCFAGSGSTLQASWQLNRNFIGIEISHEYCAIANKRIAEERKNLFEVSK